MRKDLVDIVCCPVHKTPLTLHAAKEDPRGDVLEGHLRCAACGFDYPIEEGIPNLLPPEYHVGAGAGGVAEPQAPGKTGKAAGARGGKGAA